MKKPSFYITTPIYYPSDNLHIGHAYTTVAADAIARYKRMTGHDVWFLTGSDEHGQKIERTARSKGQKPLEYVDKIVAGFKALWNKLEVSNDDFIRTTEDRHKKVVQWIFQKLYDQGDIYKSEYEGWYCTPCETFWTERQLVEGKCPDCARDVELVREESYFFKQSKYADRLLKYIEDHPDFIQPVSRRNEMVSFIKSGLEDLCVSRTTFDWGIQVPFDPKHVIYVWVDALTNYVSALGTPGEELYEKYWPADVHLVGKDIVRFHTIIWPIILMAAGLPLPKKVMGHGWLLLEGGKMSKSKGNVVDPIALVDKYSVDAIRYYLLRELPFGSDGYYTEETLVQRINADLANDYGNLVSRTTAMIVKYFGGVIPTPHQEEEAIDRELKDEAARVIREVTAHMEKLELSNALATLWRLVGKSNKYIDETAPWVLEKQGNKERLSSALYNLAECIRLVTLAVAPFMPMLPERVWSQLGYSDQGHQQTWDDLVWGKLPPGIQIQRGEALFPRIEWRIEDGLLEEISGVREQVAEAKDRVVTEKQLVKEEKSLIDINHFAQVELRVAEVIAAEKVPKADKLLQLEVSLGDEKRTIVAGIAQHYEPDQILGKKIVVVANLQPAKLRGILSQGMLLAASGEGKLALLTVDGDVPVGSRIK